MEDTTKTKKKVSGTSKTKSKVNTDPKWKAKKSKEDEKTTTKKKPSTKTVKGKTTTKKKVTTSKKVTPKEEKSPSSSISKREGKRVDRAYLTEKYNIQKTDVLNKEEIVKAYEKLENEEAKSIPSSSMNTANRVKSTSSINRAHYGFTSRVCTLVLMFLLFLVLCIIFVFKAIDYELGGGITYSEYTSNDYSVCTTNNGIYNGACLDRDLEYISSVVETVQATFDYEALFSKKNSFKANYYVVGKLKVFDKADSTRVRYTKDDVLVHSTTLESDDEVASFSVDVDVDFNNYSQIVKDYNNKIGLESSGELEVALYLEENDVSRKVSYITIPLTDDAFMIKTSNLDNQNQIVINNKEEKVVDPVYLFIAVVSMIMDVLLFIYLVNFVRMGLNSDNEYNTKLKSILKEHDDIIVNAISRYIIPEGYKVVELESFEELLDARNSLEKPIVYEKINNIKCKFYVEDDKTIYLYSMKDEGK